MTMNTPGNLVGQCHRCGGYITLVGGQAAPLGVICQFCGETRALIDREIESLYRDGDRAGGEGGGA